MSFEDIKKDWDSDKGKNLNLPASLQSLRSTQSPVVKIRKNMKTELWIQLGAMGLISILPLISDLKSDLVLPYLLMLTLLLALSFYFFTRFYFFYTKMGKLEMPTKDCLYDLFYGIKVHIELYKSFTYILLPFALIIFFFLNLSPDIKPLANAFQLQHYTQLPVYQYFLILLLFLPGVYFLTEYWVKIRYSKYADEIGDLIEDLKREEN